MSKNVTIDGVEYAPIQKTARQLVVIDRGWIFAGHVEQHNRLGDDEGYYIRNCLNVRKWQSGGFGGLTKGAKSAGATLDPCEDVAVPHRAVLFMVPISEDWHND